MSLSRSLVSLNGTWDFQLDPTGALTADALQPDRTITVPMPWQAAFPDLAQYSGFAWYRRTLELDATQLAGEVYIDFGAVDYWCEVFVNGTSVGQHEGGYMPFSVNVTAALTPGSNSLAVRVFDSVQDSIIIDRWPDQPRPQNGPPFDARDVPHGKQEWYINVGGIWQNVTLRIVPKASIRQVHVTPDITAGTAMVTVTLAGDLTALAGDLKIALSDGTSATVALVSGQAAYQAAIKLTSMHLWTIDDPFLYTATVELPVGDGVDSTSVRFGMRSFGFSNGQFLLNGEPLYLLSALDQDFYPDTIYTVPSDEFLRDQFAKAKHLGLNNLRCHIKPADPRYLDLADEMGLLIWAEIPSWRTFWNKSTLHARNRDLPEAIHQRVEQLLEEMIARDFNHPSLVIWTIVNEDWGTTLALNADDRAWVTKVYDHCKQLDPTRLVVDNSACGNAWGRNVHIKTDLDDFHVYTAIPDHADAWSQMIAQFALRPLWTFSNMGDSQRRGDEPLVLSEFGNWGLPSVAALRKHYGGEVPWFDLGPWWSGWNGEAGYPLDVEARFAALGLDKIWPDYETFATASQWHQFEAMKYEIEEMRRHGTIAGYVITEFTDCYWESNGLLDFARNPKAYHDRFAEINAPDVIVPTLQQRAFWSGDTVNVDLTVSHYSQRAGDGATLEWRLDHTSEEGVIEVGPLANGLTTAIGSLSFELPSVEAAQAVRLLLVLRAANGSVLARNELALTVYPATVRQAANAVTLAVPGGSDGDPTPLQHAIRATGYSTVAALGSEVAVTNTADEALLQWVRDGGDLLFLAEGQTPFFWVGGRGGAYSGDWMTGFNWIKPEVHPSLPNENPLGMAFRGATPHNTILGLPLDNPEYHGDVLAGMFSGWVGLPAAHTVQFRYGKGRVVLTTFPLRELAGTHPTATAMLHDLIAYLGSDRCQPTLRGL